MLPRSLPIKLLLCVILAFAAGAHAQPKKTTLTVAAYNIENLFDVFDDPYTADEGTRVKPRKELEDVAALLKKLDADVVSFEEVENEGVLKAFIRELLPEAGYKYIAAASSNDGRGIRTAIASRLPIRSITSYRFLDLSLPEEPQTWRFARDLMHVQLQISDQRVLHAFIVHLKSKRGEKDDPQAGKWRLAEAVKARQIIGELLAKEPQAWVLMMGDFNDTPDSPPIKALLSDSAGPTSKSAALIDVHAGLPNDQRITYLKKPYRSTIDYILASGDMAKRLVKDSAVVFQDESLLGGSDHAPIVAKFDVEEKASATSEEKR